MPLAWVRRREIVRLIAPIIFLASLIIRPIGAQEAPRAQPADAHTLILPLKIIAGAPATLAVLDTAGRLVPNVTVEVSGGKKVVTDVTGRGLFVAPREPGKLTAKISGQEAIASTTVELPSDSGSSPPTENAATAAKMTAYPRAIAIHDRFVLEGSGFRGVVESNQVFLADEPCLVIASSPVSLTVLPGPRVSVGPAMLRVSVAGQELVPVSVSAVSIEFDPPENAPNAGTAGKIMVIVRGGTDRLAVEVRNGSPEIIQFPHGVVQRLVTSGGEVNTAQLELKFLAAGNYTLTARLLPEAASRP